MNSKNIHEPTVASQHISALKPSLMNLKLVRAPLFNMTRENVGLRLPMLPKQSTLRRADTMTCLLHTWKADARLALQVSLCLDIEFDHLPYESRKWHKSLPPVQSFNAHKAYITQQRHPHSKTAFLLSPTVHLPATFPGHAGHFPSQENVLRESW